MVIALGILGVAFYIGAKDGLAKWNAQQEWINSKVSVPRRTDTMWN